MQEVTSSFTPRVIEASVQKFWTQEDIYARVQEQNRDGKTWFFVDGPPYTTGHIHLGTAWNKILKDSILRFKRMHGLHVIDRGERASKRIPRRKEVNVTQRSLAALGENADG